MRRRPKPPSLTNVLTAMAGGEKLTLGFEDGVQVWRLFSGQRVPPAVAKRVIGHANITPCDVALFENMPPQTWHWHP
jgi:hypothetical protein